MFQATECTGDDNQTHDNQANTQTDPKKRKNAHKNLKVNYYQQEQLI